MAKERRQALLLAAVLALLGLVLFGPDAIRHNTLVAAFERGRGIDTSSVADVTELVAPVVLGRDRDVVRGLVQGAGFVAGNNPIDKLEGVDTPVESEYYEFYLRPKNWWLGFVWDEYSITIGFDKTEAANFVLAQVRRRSF